MATFIVPAEHCWAPFDRGPISLSPEETGLLPRGNVSCLTAIGNRGPNRPPPHRRTRTDSNRWWRVNPAAAQQLADDAEVTVESLLCSGCQKMLARLRRSGDWP